MPTVIGINMAQEVEDNGEIRFKEVTTREGTNGGNIRLNQELIFQLSLGCLSMFILSIIIVLLIFKYRRGNRDNTDRTGIAINSGSLPATMTKVKIPTYLNVTTDESDSDPFSIDHNKFPIFSRDCIVQKVQPIKRTYSNTSSDPELPPRITLSINSLNHVKTSDDDIFLLKLSKVENLPRIGDGKFIPDGVFARIFRYHDLSVRSFGEMHTFKQTKKVKIKKCRSIDFTDGETYHIPFNEFPIRISLYQYDTKEVRLCVGHCIVTTDAVNQLIVNNVKTDIESKSVLTLDLHQSIALAQTYCTEFEIQ